MCNAWNHPAACTCGFGGEGHLGGGRGLGSGSAAIRTYPFHSTMRDLCRELGHSLVVPTNCRHCGRLIYLYANPDGGFAIFDSLGKPWPKHLCGLIHPTTREYYSLNMVFSSRHRFPLPDRTVEGAVTNGQFLRGSVVAIEDGVAEIFDGRHGYRVTTREPVQLGQVVEGIVRFDQHKKVLQVATLLSPSREELAASEKAASAAEGQTMDITCHNQFMNTVGRFFGRRKVVWGVFSNSNQLVAIYEFPHKSEAHAYAELLTYERRTTFYVAMFKQFMTDSK